MRGWPLVRSQTRNFQSAFSTSQVAADLSGAQHAARHVCFAGLVQDYQEGGIGVALYIIQEVGLLPARGGTLSG